MTIAVEYGRYRLNLTQALADAAVSDGVSPARSSPVFLRNYSTDISIGSSSYLLLTRLSRQHQNYLASGAIEDSFAPWEILQIGGVGLRALRHGARAVARNVRFMGRAPINKRTGKPHGSRRFGIMSKKTNEFYFRIDYEDPATGGEGLHYHRWPNDKLHRPREGL